MKLPQSVGLVNFGTRCLDFSPNHVLCGSVRIMHHLQLMSRHGWSRKYEESNYYISVQDVITSLCYLMLIGITGLAHHKAKGMFLSEPFYLAALSNDLCIICTQTWIAQRQRLELECSF